MAAPLTPARPVAYGWCAHCRAMRDCTVVVGTTDWHTERTCACRVCGHVVHEPSSRLIRDAPASADPIEINGHG